MLDYKFKSKAKSILKNIKYYKIQNHPLRNQSSRHIKFIEDIKKIKLLNNSNIEGVIIGKSIYDGDIKIKELAKEI